jgi:acetylornithine/succinyldiaminopimelate/putrescine aminotransferase
MATQGVITAVYREHDIAIHPSGKPEDALTDAFMIFEPTTNPMFTRTLYEFPHDQVKTYGTEDEAKEAAMKLARAWIDARLDKRVE